ncbi:uncharacterized protein BDZ83DRAFT_643959 [Colletotrichum acutatum]|uniref:Secreted protein n=1 Tax=Glomerella acutata TaxID=27357 RepID=A0AAD8U9H2_GLOAC|nr:uncharacterized protein BDZ83DRAFT_643959 [Colletotrichum acutatum]KAK1705926.1 hypothetical protein BDZ83DRAFT_643959 [Colletotrichum acutatum]
MRATVLPIFGIAVSVLGSPSRPCVYLLDSPIQSRPRCLRLSSPPALSSGALRGGTYGQIEPGLKQSRESRQKMFPG